jgi:type 1 glutamine amidotransferase
VGGPAGRLDAVLVCGGRWHDFDFARLQLLEHLGKHPRVRTRVFEDYAATDALDGADLLVTYTCNQRPDAEQQRRLVEFVRRGGRWLALHGTNAAIEAPAPGAPKVFTTPRVLGPVAQVLGSQFLGHPPIAPYTVQVTRPDHPLVAGIGPFEVTDELYISELHPPLEVLLHTVYSGDTRGFAEGDTVDDAPRPVLYLRSSGEGQVCYFTLGHCRGRYDMQDMGVEDLGRDDRGSWESPAFRTVLDRCLSWSLYGESALYGDQVSGLVD